MYSAKAFLILEFVTFSSAYIRMSCPGRNVRERVDPIVNPGGVAGHVHFIAGGSGFSTNMTFQDAREAKCSSCQIKEDMSNYWTPQLYVKYKNGSFAPVPVVGDPDDINGGMTVYYLQRRGDDSSEKLYAFPEGFRMIAGYTFRRSFYGDLASKAVSFNCLGSGQPETNSIPNYNCPYGLRAQVFFPACWNGRDLDSPDHRMHMSYPAGNEYNTGACPPEYPVHMVSIFFEVLYDTNLFLDQWEGDQHPFVFSNGDATGHGFHGDFFNGWDVDVLQNAVDNCNDDSGLVSLCPAVTMFTDQECNECRLPSTVTENVGGFLKKLPGCNPVTYGPSNALPAYCSDSATIGFGSTNYVDVTLSKKWQYLGCGRDNVLARAFRGAAYASSNMTVENCIDFCTIRGFPYAGLEYGSECFCATQLDYRYAPRDGVMGSCAMRCSGDSDQICGNGNAMSIYHKCSSIADCKNNEIGGKAPSPIVSSSSSLIPTIETPGTGPVPAQPTSLLFAEPFTVTQNPDEPFPTTESMDPEDANPSFTRNPALSTLITTTTTASDANPTDFLDFQAAIIPICSASVCLAESFSSAAAKFCSFFKVCMIMGQDSPGDCTCDRRLVGKKRRVL